MELLRSKGRSSRVLMLLELVLRKPRDQRSLSVPLKMTPQAVSDYLKHMRDEGLVQITEGGPRATMKGVEMLQSELLTLKDFVDTVVSNLDIIRSTDAISRGRIIRGDRCTLFIEGGLLFARKGGEGPSIGKAETDAMDGEMVALSELNGLVDMTPGRLVIAEIVPARDGGGRARTRMSDVRELIRRTDPSIRSWQDVRIAVLDLEAAALLRRSSVDFDLELPQADHIQALLDRGLSVIAVGTPFSARRLEEGLEGGRPRVEKASLPCSVKSK